MSEAGRKNGFVKVSCEFITEVMVSASEGRIPPDSIVSGVYYEAGSDSFVFQISSEILPERKELELIPLITTLTKADLSRFFQGLTGRVWGEPWPREKLVEEIEDVLAEKIQSPVILMDLLRRLVKQFAKKGAE